MYYTELLLLVFVFITFFQSAMDKITDWKGNVAWLKEHFNQSIIGSMIPFALSMILILELITAIMVVPAGYLLMKGEGNTWAMYCMLLSAVTLLLLLLGQRLAKDYDGARTIVIYLVPVLFGLWLFQP